MSPTSPRPDSFEVASNVLQARRDLRSERSGRWPAPWLRRPSIEANSKQVGDTLRLASSARGRSKFTSSTKRQEVAIKRFDDYFERLSSARAVKQFIIKIILDEATIVVGAREPARSTAVLGAALAGKAWTALEGSSTM